MSNHPRICYKFAIGRNLGSDAKPFPELIHLQLRAYDEPAPVVPDSFIDGSAPRLRYLNWDGIPYPGLPKLLLSATDLVTLQL
jgi:hypothetical protein